MRRAVRWLISLCLALCLGMFAHAAAVDETTNEAEEQQFLLEQQLDSLQLEQYDQYLQGETARLLGERDASHLLRDILSGQLFSEQDGESAWAVVWESLTGNARSLLQVMAVILVSGLLTGLSGSGNGQLQRMTGTVCSLCCVLLTMGTFAQLVGQGFASISQVTTLMRVLVPAMAGVMLWGGKALSAASMPVVVMAMCTILNELVRAVFLPAVYGYVALTCAESAFGDDRFKGFADFLKSFVVWGMGLCFTIFSAILSLQAASLRIADSAVTRTVKYTVGSFVPFVGKILSDVSDIVMGCGSMIGSGMGVFGIVLCVAVCGLPVLRALIFAQAYRLLAAISQMTGAGGLCRLLQGFSTAFMLVFAISAASSMLFIIAFAMVAGK